MRKRWQGAWGRRGGTAGSPGDVKQGDPCAGERRAGGRARVVAKKRRNGRGAKAGQEEGSAMERPTEDAPSLVAARSTQGGDADAWKTAAEPAVWTERMLAALENGVKGGKWYSLIDKVYDVKVLRAAWVRVAANAGAGGVDGVTIRNYGQRLDDELGWLAGWLREDRYVPQPVRRAWIPKPGSQERRPLGIPAVATGWCRPRCGCCWSRSSSTSLRNAVMVFVRDAAARGRCGRWTGSSGKGARGWWTQI